MVDSLTESMKEKLEQIFGAAYTIYTDGPEENFTKPCFYLTTLSNTCVPYLGKRMKKERVFSIVYFPEHELGKQTESTAVGEQLLDTMDCVELGGILIPCTSKQYEIADGTLTFKMNCNTIVNQITEAEKMNKAEVTTGLKGERRWQ